MMQTDIKLVIVCSRQTEAIAEIFKKAGVKNIISINSNSIKNDESSLLFQ